MRKEVQLSARWIHIHYWGAIFSLLCLASSHASVMVLAFVSTVVNIWIVIKEV